MENTLVEKPWGTYEVLKVNDKYWVKILTINPEQRISLQVHRNRNEMWAVIEGTGVATMNEEQLIVRKHDTIFIPEGIKHRLHNIDKKEPLIICEIATGAPKEEDIKRYEDDYDRK